ncbi:hypothetical protein [Streptomyces sp. IBSBF 2435]|uniref:hypothetical protein n=1 Tax=Streptomyces sp. IBSBF 2435 TaxID=2903531 RepID=UPI002FDBF132
MPDSTHLGPIAYSAYGQVTGFRTYDGRPMPAWEALGDTIQAAWHAAAEAITTHHADAAQEADVNSDHEQPTTQTAGGQTPSQGQIVLVGIDPLNNNGCPTAPAIITQTWPSGLVNVRIMPDGDFPTKRATSLSYVGTVAELAPGRWTWPPRA